MTGNPEGVTVWWWDGPWDAEPDHPELGPAEQSRAAAIVPAEPRAAYVASVRLRRQVLGRALGVPPADVRFEVAAGGKPGLTGAQNDLDWRFSVSHTAGAAWLAVTRAREVGVDVERVRLAVPWAGVAATAFSEAERAALSSWPRPVDGFYALWTAKEAYLKACGVGLGTPLADVTMAVAGAEVTVERPVPGDSGRWWGWRRPALQGVHAALVVAARPSEPRPAVRWAAWNAARPGGPAPQD